MSESSEGRGTVVELEMSEYFLLTGSMRRKRHREDSAYMSQRDSMSGVLSETPSPDTEGEEDQNGYVLPGLGDSPERGDSIDRSRKQTYHTICIGTYIFVFLTIEHIPFLYFL